MPHIFTQCVVISVFDRYQKSGRFEKVGYEDEFLTFLHNMILEVEKRIRRGHQRLALSNIPGTVSDLYCNGNMAVSC